MQRIHIIDRISNGFARMMNSIRPKRPRGLDAPTPYHRARYIRNRSKYYPHQGQRERLRRQLGGFAGASTDAWHPLHNLNN